jgi:hypothetical protein
MVKAGLNLKAIAQYVGTSVTMIEDNYCGNLELDPIIFQRVSGNCVDILASQSLPSWNQLIAWLRELDLMQKELAA